MVSISKNNKMTDGSIMPKILAFSVPLFFSQLLQQFYNIGDTLIVGRYLGVAALSAVGSTWGLNYFISYFCIGACYGTNILIAQQLGADNKKMLRKYFWNTIYLLSILAIIVTIVSVLLCKRMLIWSKTPSDTLSDANIYLVVLLAGLPATFFSNFCNSALTGLGNSKISSLSLAVSTVANLLMDILFVTAFHAGVGGAALATVLSQVLSGFISMIYIIRRYPELKYDNDCRPDKVVILSSFKMCVPMGLQYSFTAIGAIMLQTSVNALGNDAIAGFSAGYRIKGLFMCPIHAVGTSLATFVGQNFGAKKFERIHKGLYQTLFSSLAYSLVVMIIFLLFGNTLSMIFVNANEVGTIKCSAELLKYLSYSYFFLSVLFSFRYTVQGMGKSSFTLLSGTGEMLTRIIFAIFIIPKFGYTAVCLSEGATFLVGSLVIVPVYFIIRKKLKAIPCS